MLDVKSGWLTDPPWYKMEQTHPQLLECFIPTSRYKTMLELLLRKIEIIGSLQVVNNHVFGRKLAK